MSSPVQLTHADTNAGWQEWRDQMGWESKTSSFGYGVKVYAGLNQMGPNHRVEKFVSVTHLFYHSSPWFFIELCPSLPPVNEFGYRYKWIQRRQDVHRSHRNSPSKFCVKGNGIQARLTGVSHHKTTFFILKHKHIDTFEQLFLSYMILSVGSRICTWQNKPLL